MISDQYNNCANVKPRVEEHHLGLYIKNQLAKKRLNAFDILKLLKFSASATDVTLHSPYASDHTGHTQ